MMLIISADPEGIFTPLGASSAKTAQQTHRATQTLFEKERIKIFYSPIKSTDLSNQGKIFSQKLSFTGTLRKWDSGIKSGFGQVLLAFRT